MPRTRENDGVEKICVRPVGSNPETSPECLRNTIANCLEAIQPHASALEALHELVSSNPLDPIQTDLSAMVNEIAAFTTRDTAERIACSFQQQGPVEISGFRASIIYSFTNDDCAWPVVEWREQSGTEVLAICYVEDDAEVCSWLMHFGAGEGSDGKTWAKTWISWSVRNMGHLKSLFGAARHLLGVLGWSVDDMLKLYCRQDLEGTSMKEYALSKRG